MNGKQLKNSILQWAIQGKLVQQDPNDEPASVLLEHIREEKAKLVKEKKIKKDKNESIIYRGDDNSIYRDEYCMLIQIFLVFEIFFPTYFFCIWFYNYFLILKIITINKVVFAIWVIFRCSMNTVS